MGKASPLLSSFKLSYYTLLNLMRRMEGSGQDMEYVIKRSFQQFQYESRLPQVGATPHLLIPVPQWLPISGTRRRNCVHHICLPCFVAALQALREEEEIPSFHPHQAD